MDILFLRIDTVSPNKILWCYCVSIFSYTPSVQCFPLNCNLFVVAYANSFCASRRCCWSVEIEVSPITAVHKAHKHCFIRHYMQDEMTSKILFPSENSDIKTPAPGFEFEMCSAHFYSTKSKPFGKSICGGQFRYCGGSPQINHFIWMSWMAALRAILNTCMAYPPPSCHKHPMFSSFISRFSMSYFSYTHDTNAFLTHCPFFHVWERNS